MRAAVSAELQPLVDGVALLRDHWMASDKKTIHSHTRMFGVNEQPAHQFPNDIPCSRNVLGPDLRKAIGFSM
jgi:hypothetical protein